VDEIERLPVGRPWLTVVIDVATRMIAGFHLSFEHPSSTSVALAISHAVLPKETYLRNLGVDADWPVKGLPAMVHLDNAEEFHASANIPSATLRMTGQMIRAFGADEVARLRLVSKKLRF
jgi:putative transposase